MDAHISDGMYFPFGADSRGGAPAPCPDPPIITPVEPTVQAREIKPEIVGSTHEPEPKSPQAEVVPSEARVLSKEIKPQSVSSEEED